MIYLQIKSYFCILDIKIGIYEETSTYIADHDFLCRKS